MASQQNCGLIRTSMGTAVLKSIPTPKLRDGYILVRTVAVALNPTDWTTLDAEGDNGTLVGCDYAGIVEDVGKDASSFTKGDRVAGFGHGGNDANPETGAFARYIAVQGDTQLHMPDHLRFEDAATLAVGAFSAGYGLYKVLDIAWPVIAGEETTQRDAARGDLLVYGGSTATGSLAIQFAKLSGYRVLTTCSPKHFSMLKDRGADEVFNYRDPDVGAKIRQATHDSLTHVFDTVAIESTAAICAEAISSTKGGIYCNLLGAQCPRDDVESRFFLGYSMSGESFIFEGKQYEAQPEDHNFAKQWASFLNTILQDKKLIIHPAHVRDGGLQGALERMQEMRDGKGPSGEKWVYRIDDTVWP